MPDALPPIGFGLWKVAREEAADVAYEAIKAGYRHLDCAADYGNEIEVGQGIARAIDDGLATREELWVTSKLWNTFHAPEHVEENRGTAPARRARRKVDGHDLEAALGAEEELATVC